MPAMGPELDKAFGEILKELRTQYSLGFYPKNAQARERFGKSGLFLCGRFSAVDAMFAPVVNRFHAYDIPVSAATRAYMDAMMALPASP